MGIDICMSERDMAFVLDMDGVLYHGEQVLDGAVAFMDRISAHAHMFLTDNPARPPGRVADRLERLGFPRPGEHLIVSSAGSESGIPLRSIFLFAMAHPIPY
jgi:ribonucleotide monophosphatase NagD (HAD superfamily)